MISNEHVDVYHSLKPGEHHLLPEYPRGDDGEPKADADEKLAGVIYYGQDGEDKFIADPERRFLFAIKLGRKLQELGL